MAQPTGTIFAEIGIDFEPATKAQKQLLQDATQTSLNIERNFKNLGIKSSAEFDLMRTKITNSYNMIANSHKATANDILRAEQAKNDQLTRINEQQYGRQVSMLENMKNNYFRLSTSLAASLYAIQQIARPFIAVFEKGFGAVELYSQSVASMAAMVLTFSERAKGVSVAEQWQAALKYSSAIVPILENIAAKTLLSGQETTALANAFARQGVFLDASNQKQIESFTRISNALPLMTQGQEIMRQINTEIRALMTGANENTSMMLQTIKAIDPEIEKNLKTWRAEGTVLEHIGDLLEGFGPATALLENQWMAVKSTIDTTVTQVLRGGMFAVYGEIIEAVKGMNKLLEDHKGKIQGGINVAWSIVSNTLGSIWGILSGFGPILKDIAPVVSAIAYGWGGVLAALKPIGEFLGNSVTLTYELAKMIGQAAAAAGLLATGQISAAKTAWEETKKGYERVEKLSIANRKILTEGIADSITQYDRQARAAEESAIRQADAAKKWKPKPLEDQEELKKQEKLAEKWADIRRQLETDINTSGLSEFDKKLAEIDEKVAKYKDDLKEYKGLADATATINLWAEKAKEDAALNAATKDFDEYLKRLHLQDRLVKDAIRQKQEYVNAVNGPFSDESAAAVKDAITRRANLMRAEMGDIIDINKYVAAKMQDELIKKLAAQASFYSEIEGYEDQYRDKVFAWIDEEQKRRAKLYKDDVAAAKWAADEKGKLEYDLFKRKADYIAAGYGALENSFTQMASIYAEGSESAKSWENAARAMEIAQRSVAVVQAVAAIATQGLGDPYTAFYRISTMTAAMVSLLSSIGETVNGGSASSSSYSVATSSATTLGSEEGSQSVANSYEMLQDTYEMEYKELSGIYSEMKDLNENITGLVTSIVSTGSAKAFVSVSEGYKGGYETQFLKNMEAFSDFVNFGPTMLDKLFNSGGANILGGINTAISKGVGYVINGLFGGRTSYEMTESGISVYGKSISDLLGGAGIYGEYYNTIKKTVDGGWFKKDKTSYQTYYEAMGGDTRALFTLVYKDLSDTLVSIAAGLGADMTKTLNYTFSGFTLNLKDLSTDEISDAISSAISAVGDTAVKSLFGDILQQYQQLNEGLLETAVRIIQDKAVIEYWLDKTNQAFEGTTTEAIAFSEALIDIAGSLEDLTDAMETYYDKFFTDSEKEAKLKSDLISSLGAYGYDLPGTRTGYRSIVESLDITTDAGQAAYVALMQMAESADQYYSYLEDLASSRSESDYSSRLDYLRAISGFDNGGISSGPDSGYLAQLHGTELIISPKNGYPATVVGADSPELLAEIRLLRQEVTELKAYGKKTSNVLQRVTRDGDSMLTEAV
jgi:hypothetical protein